MHETRRRFLQVAASSMLAGTLPCGPSADGEPVRPPKESLVGAVRHLGNQFLKNSVNVTGADGATSIQLPSGESLWVFGDTVEGPFETIHGLDLTSLRSNTAAIVARQDVSQGIRQYRFLATPDGKRPRQLIPFAPDENPSVNRVWAIHGACVGKQAYLFYHRITLLDGVDVFVNFRLDGMGIARANVDDFQFERLIAPDGTREFWKENEPTFGVFAERKEDYVYLWGSLMTGMFLARVRLDSLADQASYEYLVGAPTLREPNRAPKWSRNFEPTAVLFDSVPNEMSAAYNAYLKKHVAFHSLGRDNKIVMRTAPHITGPWSEPAIIYRPERIQETDLIYAAKEHPELAGNGGRVLYVTFVNSTTYVPQMIEVTLR